jgi:hypothetical protein
MMANITELRNKIQQYIYLRLAGQMVDVELDKEHYDLAIDQALIRYRQRSPAASEESYAFLSLTKETQEYILPQEVINVRQIFRRGIGSVTGTTASQFEPFASGYLNTYMLVAGRVGGLLNYELFTQYQELAMRMFGGFVNFTFNPSSKKLTIVRKIPENGEDVLLWTDNYKPEIEILTNHMTYPWIQNYAYALAKHMLGEGRSKFASIPGPAGGSSLNGNDLKAEAAADIEKLEAEIGLHMDGSTPMWFVIG